MKINDLSKQDQIYYYHGLILHLADEVSKFEIYNTWLQRYRSIDELKKRAKSLQDEVDGILEVSKCNACGEYDTIYHTSDIGFCQECGTPEDYEYVLIDDNGNEIEHNNE